MSRPLQDLRVNDPGNPVHGLRCVHVANRIGGKLVELLEERGAYKVGDRVQLDTGTWVVIEREGK